MKHISVPVENTMEVLEYTNISPLVTECNIKVLYVGDTPNRNGTVITRAVAEELGKNLPGSPVVGYYDKQSNDFAEHSRSVEIDESGEYRLVDLTKPYGFVGSKVWFQDFYDDNQVQRTYLCAQAYIWTESYPEAKKILENNNNQSMELHSALLSGSWANDLKTGQRFFIINEALVERLCILGENVEPCFEGAQVRTTFSLKNEILKLSEDIIKHYSTLKGGLKNMDVDVTTNSVETVTEDLNEDVTTAATTESVEYKKSDEDEKKKEDAAEQNDTADEPEDSDDAEDDDDDKKKKKDCQYILSEVREYVELAKQYMNLEQEHNDLQAKYSTLEAEVKTLREFKETKDLADKQTMIDKFYMLSDADKQDVRNNIKNYSVDEIEAKLSVICVRNKVNFADPSDAATAYTFDINSPNFSNSNDVPERWMKAVQDVENNM